MVLIFTFDIINTENGNYSTMLTFLLYFILIYSFSCSNIFIILYINIASAVLVAVVSAGTGRIDRVIIEGAIGYYHRLFGLKIKSEEIEFLVNTYWQDSIKEGGAIFALERVVKYGLVVGVTIAGTKSFILALQYLVRSVNELEKAALAVWDNAVKQINSG